ncbi:peptide/nickel transport system substrate-binding protein [Trinickia symbiotica]|uniref:Peptide ABC transporter substrate-binding protein n=1 Tax=Trinickia symbiotica TaxID=863227 RepID=A0A2N7X3M0_9BURK|nr:ABC transporter substrate-binding protein [Trinickia symbiotica]PMS36214.1 peptide ABC transporter substrate-binding protein [Trinickia symbiotica]PPK45915.1 peptide/nickel transport system substrate-binding protein [Trinickia symbiotica]
MKARSDRPSLLEAVRRDAGELGNHAIDEYLAERLSRRELLRYAGVMGLSGVALALGGLALPRAAAAQAKPSGAGATIRVAHLTPAGAVDPLTVADPAGLALIAQTGEFLIDDQSTDKPLTPALALSWQANAKGDVWTFKLRPNVKFHDGQTLTAKDVVATFDRLADPASGSAALSLLKGVLSKGGTRAIDDGTVAFHLDAPNGNFPYYVSSDNYNAVILPASFSGGYEKSFIGTGPFKLERYEPKVGASFVRNPEYWGEKALPSRVQFSFYADQQAQILAMEGRQADVMGDFTVQGGAGLLNNPEFVVQSVRSSAHRQIHMRCDQAPFNDKRVRQALALALDRDRLVKGLFKGRAVVGNDHPFAPVFPSYDPSVPQRRIDVGQAKQLLAQAGHPNGIDATLALTTEKFMEIPDLAVVVQNAAKAIGMRLQLKVESQSLYYGAGTFGKSDWLDSTLGITDYGHRGVPNLFLNAPLTSNGAWNAAHFKNATYDKLVADYVGALDVGAQKKVAHQIEALLLDETPVVIPYFFDMLIARRKTLDGVRFTAISQMYFDRATLVT